METNRMRALRSGRLFSVMALALLASACTPARSSGSGASASMIAANGSVVPESPLGSYLAAQHAQVVHDYSEAAGFLDRALAADPGNYDLVRRTFLLRVSDGRIADAVPLAQRIVSTDGRS